MQTIDSLHSEHYANTKEFYLTDQNEHKRFVHPCTLITKVTLMKSGFYSYYYC